MNNENVRLRRHRGSMMESGVLGELPMRQMICSSNKTRLAEDSQRIEFYIQASLVLVLLQLCYCSKVF